MGEKSEESLAFAVRVFTLREEEVSSEEDHMDTHEEVGAEAAGGALLLLAWSCLYGMHL